MEFHCHAYRRHFFSKWRMVVSLCANVCLRDCRCHHERLEFEASAQAGANLTSRVFSKQYGGHIPSHSHLPPFP